MADPIYLSLDLQIFLNLKISESTTTSDWLNRFFFDCLFHRDLRLSLSHILNGITTFTLNTILFGHDNLSLHENQRIFNAVHTYIRISRRVGSNV